MQVIIDAVAWTHMLENIFLEFKRRIEVSVVKGWRHIDGEYIISDNK
jgi:hypothetical protein